MKLRIVYATNSGATKEVAELIASDCARAGHHVDVKSAEYTKPDHLKGYDCVILGSCTWEMKTPARYFEGQLQQHMAKLRDALKGMEMPGQRFAVFGLGDSSYTNFCIAANHLEALVKQLKAIQVGETLKIDAYFFDQENNRKKIARWTRDLLKVLG